MMSRSQHARNAEIYRRTVLTGELTRQEAAEQYGVCEATVHVILTQEHQRANPGTRRPAVPRDRCSAPDLTPADARARNREIRRRVSAGEIKAAETARQHSISRQRVSQILKRPHQDAYAAMSAAP